MPDNPSSKTGSASFIELQAVDSTNNYARELIDAGRAGHGQAIFSHYQHAGKGQRGKSWSSEKGKNLIVSILLDPYPLQVVQQFQLSACVAVSVHQFFSYYAGDESKIKWPNDIFWQDKKAGGILIESRVYGGDAPILNSTHTNWQWAIIGIGLNINQVTFDHALNYAVSLKQITGKTFNVIDLAKELTSLVLKNFDLLVSNGFEYFLRQYNYHLYKLGQRVKLKKDSRVFESKLKAVSAQGKLIVEHAFEEEFDFGQVEWIL